jgi:hypothetical protein
MAAGSLWRFAYLHAIWPPAFVKAEDAVPAIIEQMFVHLSAVVPGSMLGKALQYLNGQ